MKVVGIMCVKDEADLLPEVLDHLEGELDGLYAYDDGSTDNTGNILLDSPVVTYMMAKAADRERLLIKRPHYHHLLEKIKENYDYENESVWVVITMGDRFFLNKTPREIVADAEADGYTTVNSIQLDFLRHRATPWTKDNDNFPEYSQSLREICKWFKFDESCIIAFKLSNERSYKKSKYPWPKGGNDNVQYKLRDMDRKLNMSVPFLEHQGRRSPNGMLWRVESGSRKLSKKITLNEYSFDGIVQAWTRFYSQHRLIPWKNVSSLNQFIRMYNDSTYDADGYYQEIETCILEKGAHEREDI